MTSTPTLRTGPIVALLAEGVDRNQQMLKDAAHGHWSPSSRRAWIEIGLHRLDRLGGCVALLAEGVDRNIHKICTGLRDGVALLAEGVDRNRQGKRPSSRLPQVALLAEGVDRNWFG